ncbi:hypothetical protein bcgnr5390_14720 [Bacillus luti]|nr:hypothetical protein BC2903_46850 [Bacillus cereus]
MKKWFSSLLLVMIIFSNAWWVPKAEAIVCPPGQFPWVTSFSPNDDNPGSSSLSVSCRNPVEKDNADKNVSETVSYYAMRIKILQLFSTTIAFGLLVAAGHAYIFSGGQDKEIERAKSLLILSGVGFFVTSAGFIIFKLMQETMQFGFLAILLG